MNAKGLIYPAKRSCLWKLAKDSHCKVLCVQETHSMLRTNLPAITRIHTYIQRARKPNNSNKKQSPTNSMTAIPTHKAVTLFSPALSIPWYLFMFLIHTRYAFCGNYRKVNAVKQGGLLYCGYFNIISYPLLDSSAPPNLASLLNALQLLTCGNTSMRGREIILSSHYAIKPTPT